MTTISARALAKAKPITLKEHCKQADLSEPVEDPVKNKERKPLGEVLVFSGELPLPEISQAELEAEEENVTLSMVQLMAAVPKNCKTLISQKLLDEINHLIESTPVRETYRDNLLCYTTVLQEGKFKLRDYVKAIHYATCKLMGDSNIVAYTKTFPDRYQRFVDKGWDNKSIHAMVSVYAKGVLVTRILAQAMIPTWLVNQDTYQKAINTQADLMMNARSEKVRCDAANSLLTQLKMPETAKIKVDITATREDDSINELRKSTFELIKQQRTMIEIGLMSAQQVAEQKVVSEQ